MDAKRKTISVTLITIGYLLVVIFGYLFFKKLLPGWNLLGLIIGLTTTLIGYIIYGQRNDRDLHDGNGRTFNR